MTTRTVDLTETCVNIDNLLDVFIQTQKENGIDVGMVEVDVSIDNDGKVIRDKFGHHREKTVQQKQCSGCATPCNKQDAEEKSVLPWYMQNKLGLFGEDASDELEIEDDDGDDTYICGYCNELGFKKEYKSYICDTCRSCETCSEYEAGDCDGCTYSMYRTGELYSRQLARRGDHSYLEEEEKELIADIEDGNFDDPETREFDSSFTIMDYDHTYEN